MSDTPKLQIRNSTAEFLIFTNQNQTEGIEVRFQNEMIWLTQRLMAKLFDCSTDNISLHLKNIFAEGELTENSVTEDYSVTASDGKNYRTKHYNLDAIIAVGYRVNSQRATVFRQWATGILRDFAIRGYVIDRKRMENAYLDLAEDRAKRHIPMTMEDWAKRLDLFLLADDREILQNSGTITAAIAKDFAESEFEKFRIRQDQLFESDFDKIMKQQNI